MRFAPGEHRLGAIEADRLAGLQLFVQHLRQFAGAAAKIDGRAARCGRDHTEQIEKRLAAFVAEAFVL